MEQDVLRIEYRLQVEEGEPLVGCIVPSLWVNDECVSEGFVVDLRNLVATLKGSGEYEIVTCSCGEPGCAGIWQGIIVFHYYDLIRWLIPVPISKPFEPDENEQERIITFKDRYFRKEDYSRVISSAIAEAKRLALQNADSIRAAPHGFSVQDLLDMRIS